MTPSDSPGPKIGG